MSSVPPVQKLGNLTLKVGSGSTPRGGEAVYKTSGIPLIRSMNVHFGGFKSKGLVYLDEQEAEKLNNVIVQPHDVLLNITGASIGRVTTAPESMSRSRVNQHVCIIRPKPELNPSFLAFFLSSPEEQARVMNVQVGATRQALTKAMILNWDIPVPAPNEQREIVAEIEKQFTRLDAGVAALRCVQANLKRYRASVLKAACEGHLVPTEAELARADGRSYEPADMLLARILAERRQKWSGRGNYQEPAGPDSANLPRLPDGWTWTTVEQVGSVQLGRQRSPKHHSGDFMRPYLRVANVFEDRIDLRDVKEMNFTPQEFETFRLKPMDILLNEGQSLELIGRPAMYRGEMPGACFTNTLVRFRPYDLLDSDFALTAFRAFMHAGRFQKIAKWTTNIAHLGADRFAKMPFPLPSLTEQKRIVTEVERQLSVVKQIEGTVTANLQRAARLRQSILQNAFRGKSQENVK